jgi:predicted permease
MPPADAAVFGLQSGMGNVGYTLGGAICFVLWGIQGLALEQMFCMMWPFFAFLFCFPIARHYGESAAGADGGDRSLAAFAVRTLGRSLRDLRSLPLYMATLGLALNLAGAPPPEKVREWHIIDILMIVGIFVQFGSIGMTVRASRMPLYWRKALGSAAIKFLVSPLLMLGAAAAMGMAGAAAPVPLYVCLLLAFMPTAVYSVLMANLFGLNKDLANTTFILTHAICFAVVIPAMIVWHWAT